METFMHVVLLILVLLYVFTLILLGVRKIHKQSEPGFTPSFGVRKYIFGIAKAWTALTIVLLIVLFSSISFSDIGFRSISLPYNAWFTIITFALCGVLLIYSLVQLIAPLISVKYRQAILNMIGPGERSLMPCNAKERLLWIGVSMTAGISEEIIFRGFLYYLLASIFTGISPVIIVLAASLIFGIGHSYQGVIGVLKTAAVGALLGCLYLTTDSLLPVILLHFFVDVANVFLHPRTETPQIINDEHPL